MNKLILSILISTISLNGTFLKDAASYIIIDTSTHLMWQDDYAVEMDSQKSNWATKTTYCQNLERANKDDWRVPTIDELSTILDLSTSNPSLNDTFTYGASGIYWSNSESPSDSSKVWGIDFASGKIQSSYSKTSSYFVRCVRNYK